MDLFEILKGAVGNSAWAILAIFLIKYFMDDKNNIVNLIDTNAQKAIRDVNKDKEKLMEILVTQNSLLADMKQLLSVQAEMLNHYDDTLDALKVAMDKMSDIQMLHATKLDKIEERLAIVEKQTQK